MRTTKPQLVLLVLVVGLFLQACGSGGDAGPVDQAGKKGGTPDQRGFKEGK